jgi:hypothetical protein
MAEEIKELESEEEIGSAADFLDDGSVVVDKFYAAEAGGIDCIVGKDLVIRALAERQSLFPDGCGKYITVTAEVGKTTKGKAKEVIGFNTGSTVLIKQLQQLEGHLPVHATIEKIKGSSGYNYYQIQQG